MDGVSSRNTVTRSAPSMMICRAPVQSLWRRRFQRFVFVDRLCGTNAWLSWAPEQRGRYVEHLWALTGAGTQTLLVTLEYPQAEMKGPPFSVDSAEVHRLYSRHHSIHELGRRDVLDNEPRMRARGLSSLTEVCYRITGL